MQSINPDRTNISKIIGYSSNNSISRIGTLKTSNSKTISFSFIKAEEGKWKPILQNLIKKYEEGNLESLNEVDKDNEEILLELYNALNDHYGRQQTTKLKPRNCSFISSPSYISEIEKINRRIGTMSLNPKTSSIDASSNLPSIISNTFSNNASNLENKKPSSIEALTNKSMQIENSIDICSSSQIAKPIKIDKDTEDVQEMFELLQKLTSIRNTHKNIEKTNTPSAGQKMRKVQFEIDDNHNICTNETRISKRNPYILLNSLTASKKPFKERLSRLQNQETINEKKKAEDDKGYNASSLTLLEDINESSVPCPSKKSSFKSALKMSRIPSVKVFEKNKSLNIPDNRNKISIFKSAGITKMAINADITK
jgi:hypothetical protein